MLGLEKFKLLNIIKIFKVKQVARLTISRLIKFVQN